MFLEIAYNFFAIVKTSFLFLAHLAFVPQPTFDIAILYTKPYRFSPFGTMGQSARGLAPSKPSMPSPEPDVAINSVSIQQPINITTKSLRRSARAVAKKPATIQQPKSTPSKSRQKSRGVKTNSRVEKSASKKRESAKKAPAGKEPRHKKDPKVRLEENGQFQNLPGDIQQESMSKASASKLGPMTISYDPSLSPRKSSLENPISSGPARLPFVHSGPQSDTFPQPPPMPVAQPELQASPVPLAPHTPILQPLPQDFSVPLASMKLEEKATAGAHPPSNPDFQSEQEASLDPLATMRLEEVAKTVTLTATDLGFINKAFLVIKSKIAKTEKQPEDIERRDALRLLHAGRRLIAHTRCRESRNKIEMPVTLPEGSQVTLWALSRDSYLKPEGSSGTEVSLLQTTQLCALWF